MNLELEDELRLAMQEFTSDVHAPPDLLARLPRRTRRRFPRLAVATAAAAAALVVVGVVRLGEHVGGDAGGGAQVRPLSTFHVSQTTALEERRAAQESQAAIEQWGPTRGDRADDAALITALRQEWEHPTQHPTNLGSFEPVQSPDGPVKVLWAGSTPDGVAAVAVQHSKDRVAQYWYGIFLPGGDGRPHLAQRGQLIAGVDLGEFDSHMLSFTTSPAHHAVVVLPMTATDAVRIAFSSKPAGNGMVVPEWKDVPTRDGAAVATVPAGGNVWGTVVEALGPHQSRSYHGLDFIATHLLNEGPPQPANLLPMWCNGCSVGNGGPGYSKAMLSAWLVRHGPAYLPAYTSMWSVGGSLPDGRSVLAMQLWVVGQPARTVVMLDDEQHSQVDVLYDAETKPSDRPLVAVRLTGGAGWLVGAGPDAFVTGWRATASDAWHAVARKKALLVPTDAGSIQLRLIVAGKQRVVTR